jgi:hypothetical protein
MYTEMSKEVHTFWRGLLDLSVCTRFSRAFVSDSVGSPAIGVLIKTKTPTYGKSGQKTWTSIYARLHCKFNP